MRVLQVSCFGLGNGGVQNVIMNICRNLREVSFDIILFTEEIGYHEEEFKGLGGKIFRILRYSGSNKLIRGLEKTLGIFRIFSKVLGIIRSNGPYDAIHCHNGLDSAICLLAAKCLGINTRIVHIHRSDHNKNDYGLKKIYINTFLRIVEYAATFKIACSMDAAISFFGEKNNCKIIYNGADLDKFNYNKNKLKNINEDSEIRISHVGQYCENKNQEFLIRMIPIIKKNYNKNVRLSLVGFNDEYKQELKEVVHECLVDDDVLFLEHDTDLIQLLKNTDIVIFPSKSEGFGIFIIEAQAMDVICLVSDAVTKVLDTGLCEFLPLENGSGVWCESAIKMIEDRYKYKKNFILLSKFDYKKISKEYKEIYYGEK